MIAWSDARGKLYKLFEGWGMFSKFVRIYKSLQRDGTVHSKLKVTQQKTNNMTYITCI